MDQLGTKLSRLAKNLNSADDDGKAAGAAIQAIGLNIDDLRSKKPGEALFEIAKGLDRFEDGASKVAVATALMGREGARMLPYLKDLAESGELQGRITGDQARAAEQLEKDWRRLKMAGDDLGSSIAERLIPGLATMTENLSRAAQSGGLLKQAWIEINKLIAAGMGMAGAGWVDDWFVKIDRLKSGRGASGSWGEPIASGAKKALEFKTPEKSAPAAVSAFDTLKRQMEEHLSKIGELTVSEQTLALLETERYRNLSSAERGVLLDLAMRMDIEKENAQRIKEYADFQKQAAEERARAQLQEADRLKTNGSALVALIDPIQKYRLELEKIRELREKGLISPEQQVAAEFVVQEAIEKEQGLNREIKKTSNLWTEMGFTAASAFEDIIVKGGTAREVVQGLMQDLLRIFVRNTVTQPLGAMLGNLFAGGGGSTAGDMAFASGGSFDVGGAGGTDSQRVSFWATPGERVTVTPPGQASGVTIVQNIHVDSRSDVASVRQAMRVAKDEAVIEMSDRMRRGSRP